MAGKKGNADETIQLLKCIVDAIEEKKGLDVVSIEIGELQNAVCDYFVICHANSTTQVDAIAGNIEFKTLELQNQRVYRSSGYENAIWIVLDYIDIVVHVFLSEWRNYYKIEELWADGKHAATCDPDDDFSSMQPATF